MNFRNIVQSFLTIGTGFIVIIIAIFVGMLFTDYSGEKKHKRLNQEFAEAKKSIEKNIAASKRMDEVLRQSRREGERKTRLYNISLSTAFTEGRCRDFLKDLDFEEPVSIPERLLQADLYMRGKCYEQDYAKAFVLYQNSLTEIYEYDIYQDGSPLHLFDGYYGHIAHIKFRLATLYWRGQGVSQDKKKARELSKEAAIMWVVRYAKINHRPPELDLGPPNVWNMSDADILENVTFHATGPWDMPEPLIQQINGLTEIHKGGGQAYLDIGLHLLKGTGGYEQDQVMAYEWIYIASHFYDYGPAHYPRALLIRDEEFYEKKRNFPVFSLEFNLPRRVNWVVHISNGLLLQAVKAGDIRADKEFLSFYQSAPAFLGQEEGIYFWMLRLYQQNDPGITEEALENYRKKLDKYQISLTEENVKENRFHVPSSRLWKTPINED